MTSAHLLNKLHNKYAGGVPNSNHIMIDLETLSTRATAKIISIGAVEFSPAGLGSEFYIVLDTDQQVHSHESKETLEWWAKQSPEARAVLTAQKVDHADGMQVFAAWLKTIGNQNTRRIWGNGANFDNPIVSHGYEAYGLKYPHWFYNDRCYRTLKAMFKAIPADPFEGTAHNALADAKNQALHAIKILNEAQLWATV